MGKKHVPGKFRRLAPDRPAKLLKKLPKLSVRGLAEALADQSHKSCRQQLDAYTQIHTPYGKLLMELDLGPMRWSVCNPFALLWLISSRRCDFVTFLRSRMGSPQHGDPACGGLVLYCDGTTPGNAIAKWTQREVTCWYWTIAELPAWFRTRQGWFPFGYMKTSLEKQVPGQLSGVTKHVLRAFFSTSGFSFCRGMRLPDGDGHLLLRLSLRCFMQDGAAHKHVSSTKGASGYICCLNCRNICNTEPGQLVGTRHLHHYATAKPGDFLRHDRESFYEQCDKLMVAKGNMTVEKFKDLQIAYGMTFDPESIVYDKELRSVYCPVDHTYWDPMHCLLCSGGIAQYELNEFMLQASEPPVNISLADVDSWCASINYPRGVKRLRPTFFTKRVQMEHNCHLRCFASECLLAIDVTNLFFEQKMEPAGLMLEHGKCLRMLKSISDILFKCPTDQVLRQLKSLEKLIDEHHTLFIKNYGLGLAKIKTHWIFHIPDCIQRSGFVTNCFRPESMHKPVHDWGEKVSGPKYGEYILKRSLLSFVESLPQMGLEPNVLIKPEPTLKVHPSLRPYIPDAASSTIEMSKTILTVSGEFRIGDVIAVRGHDGKLKVVISTAFASAMNMFSGQCSFFMLCQECRRINSVSWATPPSSQSSLAVPVGNIIAKTLYTLQDNGWTVRPLMPWNALIIDR